MNRLKHKEIQEYREKLLKEQKFICPLCKHKIKPEEACLDHDHQTGYIRGVLHRNCNDSEGKVLRAAKRSNAKDPIIFLSNLGDYHRRDYSHRPFHPKHLTQEEKEIKALKKRQKSLKTQRGRDRLQTRIDALKAMMERK